MLRHEYYSRQTILKDVGEEGQLKLTDSKVLIVGAGGLGHPAATYLAASGVGEISIIDFDKVEQSNLNRQVCFTPDDVGENKSWVLVNRLRQQNPYIKTESILEKLTANNAKQIISQFDLIIDCCDNFATKFLIHDTAWMLKKDLIQASIYQYEGQVQTFNYSVCNTDGCLRCLWKSIPEKSCTGTCEEAGVIGAVAGVLGSIQAMEAVKKIVGIESNTTNITTTVNLISLETQKIKWRKDDECILCSKDANIIDINENNYLNQEIYELIGIEHPAHVLVDIREKEEGSRTDMYLNWPLSNIDQWINEISDQKDYLFICSKGVRSKQLVKNLRLEKKNNCYSLYGGLDSL